MPLINCPDCKNSVSDRAVNCPHCGYPIKNLIEGNQTEGKTQNHMQPITALSKPKNGCGTVIIVILVLVFFIFLIGKCSNNVTESTATEIETPVISKEDSIKNVAKIDSINKQYEIEEKQFLRTKAGKIYKKHPTWSKEDCKNLANNKIWIGMEYEMVVYLRGKPNDINTSNYGNGPEYQACWEDYNPGCFYFGENHIITSYN